jgi:uncharacterized protein YcsI (UPF0317 family)
MQKTSGEMVRLRCRRGEVTGPTAGLAPGLLQANLVLIPNEFADDFRKFCRLNPRPCPLLGVTTVGDPTLPALGRDIDLRTDLPRYRVWIRGKLTDEPIDIKRYWRNDLVGFALGCSFSFESALAAAGIQLRHIVEGRNVAMYRTNISCEPASRFAGPMVVSMRPIRAEDVRLAVEVTAAIPNAHGAPVHIGDPASIGITDINKPDYGDPINLHPGEVPVFWACGVTPQAALEAARLEFAITHFPGSMLVTDCATDDPVMIEAPKSVLHCSG